jgi:hypothetical protein
MDSVATAAVDRRWLRICTTRSHSVIDITELDVRENGHEMRSHTHTHTHTRSYLFLFSVIPSSLA